MDLDSGQFLQKMARLDLVCDEGAYTAILLQLRQIGLVQRRWLLESCLCLQQFSAGQTFESLPAVSTTLSESNGSAGVMPLRFCAGRHLLYPFPAVNTTHVSAAALEVWCKYHNQFLAC